MRTNYLILWFLVLFIVAHPLNAESLVVVTNKNFPLTSLNEDQLKQIFLKRTRYIENTKIFPINIQARKNYRKIFEKSIMKMNAFALKKHWTKAHYHGLRPPKVLSSIESTLAFIRSVDGAIAYIPFSKLPDDLHVILKVTQ